MELEICNTGIHLLRKIDLHKATKAIHRGFVKQYRADCISPTVAVLSDSFSLEGGIGRRLNTYTSGIIIYIYIYKLVEKKIRNGKFGKDNDLHFFTRSGRILKMGLEFDGPVDDQLTAGGLGGRGPGPWSPWPPSPFPDGSACGRRSEGGRRKKSASASTTQHMTKNMPSGWLFPPTGP